MRSVTLAGDKPGLPWVRRSRQVSIHVAPAFHVLSG
jgi:hypothetical protein